MRLPSLGGPLALCQLSTAQYATYAVDFFPNAEIALGLNKNSICHRMKWQRMWRKKVTT